MCQFLFDKLIFPVLQNPDMNDVGKDMIVSFNTRKTLSDIYYCMQFLNGDRSLLYREGGGRVPLFCFSSATMRRRLMNIMTTVNPESSPMPT